MLSLYYVSAFTDSGRLICCFHEHQTVLSAAACVSSAGGFVLAVEDEQLRELGPAEEREFNQAMHGGHGSCWHRLSTLIVFIRFQFL